MRRVPPTLLQAKTTALRAFFKGLVKAGTVPAAALLALSPTHVLAQDAAIAIGSAETAPSALTAAMAEFDAEGRRRIAFEADELRYEDEDGGDIVTATGDVLVRSGDQSVRADTITWNRLTGAISATGQVRFVDPDGNQLFTETLELTDELKAAAMSNLLLAFRAGGRLAALEAQRMDNGDIALEKAVYSTCAIEDSDGCPKKPSWQVTAERVFYDAEADTIRFEGAFLELFGKRVLPMPGLEVRADGGATSGIFIPDIAITASNGLELTDSYYWRLDDSRDLTLTGFLYTGTAPMVSAAYRQLNEKGAFQATAYLTYGTRIPLGANIATAQKDIRGYIAANGRYQLGDEWTLEGSLRYATDRTFLRRYDISREDRLRTMARAERIDDSSYFSLTGWATQALLVQTPQGAVPIALPVLDYRKRIKDETFGGMLELQANTLAITRTEGQNTQRAFARAQWDLRRITSFGQEVTLTGVVRGDVYHSSDNLLTSTQLYRGESGWQARAVAIAALDVKWPFIGEIMGGTQILTPRAQLVVTPGIRNLDIPNEDARAIDLEDSNLFSLNRFPGYDRVEEGARVTFGVDWQANFPGWRIKTTIGQSYRLTDAATLFPDGTGLTEKFSDLVGRTEVRYHDTLKFTHRFRLDKDNLAVRRNEVDATFGSDRNYVEMGYLRLDRNIDSAFEDLRDREEVRFAGRYEFSRFWSIFGSAVINLTDRDEDPTLIADGFEPLRTRLGFAYADDCLEFGFTWRRDYIQLADAQSGNSFRVHFALRNLGFR